MWRERVKILNSRADTQLFEVWIFPIFGSISHSFLPFADLQVSASGTLVGGDIVACREADDAYPVTVVGLKPGIWHIALVHNNPASTAVSLRWVATGSLSFDNLPATVPNPVLSPLSPPQWVASYAVDGGIHGLFDRDSLSHLIRVERNNRDYVLEAISDYWRWGKNLAVQIGFVGKPWPNR